MCRPSGRRRSGPRVPGGPGPGRRGVARRPKGGSSSSRYWATFSSRRCASGRRSNHPAAWAVRPGSTSGNLGRAVELSVAETTTCDTAGPLRAPRTPARPGRCPSRRPLRSSAAWPWNELTWHSSPSETRPTASNQPSAGTVPDRRAWTMERRCHGREGGSLSAARPDPEHHPALIPGALAHVRGGPPSGAG